MSSAFRPRRNFGTMLNSIRRIFSRLKHGEPIIIVSGLPRSGTSMMMKMLEAGGLEVLTDGVRTADEDNPKGYYEFERVKDLDKTTDKAWVGEAKGKVVKVISFLLKDLPPDFNYRVIFMRRRIGEILASQNKMLVRRGESPDVAGDEKMARNYQAHLLKVNDLLRRAPNFEAIYVDYHDALEKPAESAEKIKRFLESNLDASKMTGIVDQQLYRNRQKQPSDRK